MRGNGGSDAPGSFSIGWPFGPYPHGRLFFDTYSTRDGKKLVTISAHFSVNLPEEVYGKTDWVTDRFFLIPMDEHNVRFVICDFGKTP